MGLPFLSLWSCAKADVGVLDTTPRRIRGTAGATSRQCQCECDQSWSIAIAHNTAAQAHRSRLTSSAATSRRWTAGGAYTSSGKVGAHNREQLLCKDATDARQIRQERAGPGDLDATSREARSEEHTSELQSLRHLV